MPRLTSKGQVTIPKPVRCEMGWKPGDALAFAVKDGAVSITKALDLEDLLGIVQTLSAQNGDPPLSEDSRWAEQRERAWSEETRRFAHETGNDA